MRQYIFVFFTFLLVLFSACSNNSKPSIDIKDPTGITSADTGAHVSVDAPASADAICNVTTFRDDESCFRVAGGGLGTIVIRDIMKTGVLFRRYTAVEADDPDTGKSGMCFELYDTDAAGVPPFLSECYTWDEYQEILVYADMSGNMEIGLVKVAP
ncbi:MAG: hypothetical protein U0176_04120 [Bacteroidia bacterium]